MIPSDEFFPLKAQRPATDASPISPAPAKASPPAAPSARPPCAPPREWPDSAAGWPRASAPPAPPTMQTVTPPKSEIRPFSFWSQCCLARDHRERISPRRGRKPETDWRERCTNSRELSSFSKRPTGDEVADGVYHRGGTRQGLCRGGLDHQRYPNAFFEKCCANLSLRLG